MRLGSFTIFPVGAKSYRNGSLLCGSLLISYTGAGGLQMRLHYEVQGDGRPLVILHGFLGSSENWRAMRKLFATTYKVFSVDQRNHEEIYRTASAGNTTVGLFLCIDRGQPKADRKKPS